MKKLIITSVLIISVCFAVNRAIAADSRPASAEVHRTYIIKNYEGKVACFETDEKTPFIVTDVETKNLPPLDRKMLENGVEVVGAKAMSRALEDYKS